MSHNGNIIIRGAKEHNLKNINLELPRNKLIVVTGLSGSGKSSLAFDTIYAEGQRRYVESLSAYARQFLGQLQKPDVEHIEGLGPAISIEQRTAGGNPRSTVATQTEIYDYLRLLFARIGKIHCPKCKRPIKRQSSQEIVKQIMDFSNGVKIELFAALVRGRKGEYQDIFDTIHKAGFVRARIDGKIFEAADRPKLSRYKIHNIEVVIDRLIIKPGIENRLTDSIETALKVGKGIVIVSKDNNDLVFSERYACAKCEINIEEIEPRTFSFNSPYGACQACNGLGIKMEFDEDLVIPDRDKPVLEAILPWRRGGRGYILYYRSLLRDLAREINIDLTKPFKKLSKEHQKIILYGSNIVVWNKPFEGVIPNLERLFKTTDSDYLKEEITRFMSALSCPSCKGARLKKEALNVTIQGKSIYDVVCMPIKDAQNFFKNLKLSATDKIISEHILKEIFRRLKFCIDVGLDYLTLDRKSQTLSGGEAQRIRLATQVGSGLVGVVYILDEPSIGLHLRDTKKLLLTLKSLRDLGNTVIVVEHDEETIRSCDWIVDLGPGAGRLGGEVNYSGSFNGLLKHSSESLTAGFLKKELEINIPEKRRDYRGKKCISIKGCQEHNLKNINIEIPLGVFTCVSGVSGSGKSTFVNETLYRALAQRLYNAKLKPGKFKKLEGSEFIDKIVVVDQAPIGRTPRSNPATYTGIFSHIRQLFSQLPEARVRGYKPGRFSFNVKGGRCEACRGDGIKKIEMHFLPDVYVQCQVCKGERFNEQTLKVRYKGKSIADVLDMPVDDALKFFENIPPIARILQTISDVGLGYIQLGQSATTLSGGEAQRVKLSSELSHKSTGKTLYVLDEPTTGLHFADVEKLIVVLNRLVDAGNSVVIIEHNPDVIKVADYIIDLGPEGGDEGGRVVCCGSPEEITENRKSHTGFYLRKFLR